MKTQTRPKTAPDLLSQPLLTAGDLTGRLQRLLRKLGTDLNSTHVIEDIESLDLRVHAGSSHTQAHVGTTGDSMVGARYAATALCRMLGAPIPSVHDPMDPPELPKKRRLTDIEVLTYRSLVVSHSARAVAIFGALEQQATTSELVRVSPDDLVTVNGLIGLRCPGTRSLRPGCVMLPDWAQPHLDGIDGAAGPWLLTNSKSGQVDGRNSAIMMWISARLDEALGWTRPSPAAIARTALARVAEKHGLAAAHRFSRHKSPTVTEGALLDH